MMSVGVATRRLRPNFDVRIAAVVATTSVAAVSLEMRWVAGWYGGLSANYLVLLSMVLLAAAASHFPVELTPRFKTDVSTAVHFTILLLAPAPVAVALVGLSVLIGNSTLAMRRNSAGRRKRGLYDTAFNTSQAMIATGVGAVALYTLRPETPIAQMVQADAWAVPVAALTMYLTSTSLVALVVGLHTGRKPLDVWLATQRLDIPSEAALYLIGFITAVLTEARPWAPFVMIIPTAVVYLATKRAVLLNEQTIAAVEAMADMVDQRDSYTAEHSKRVAANVALIAPAMGLRREEVAAIRLAARVHDLGKIALPDSVLKKEGKLTNEEYALVKEHPRLGCEILAKFPQYRKGRDIVLAHHERMDGKGYPRGLVEHQIPLGARIIAVADALDAMTSSRPYRAAMPLHQAMTVLRLGRGTQWSAAVVDAVDRLVNVEQGELAFGNAATVLSTG